MCDRCEKHHQENPPPVGLRAYDQAALDVVVRTLKARLSLDEVELGRPGVRFDLGHAIEICPDDRVRVCIHQRLPGGGIRKHWEYL